MYRSPRRFSVSPSLAEVSRKSSLERKGRSRLGDRVKVGVPNKRQRGRARIYVSAVKSWILRLADYGTWSANVQCNHPIAGSVITEVPEGDARNYGMEAHRCMESWKLESSRNRMLTKRLFAAWYEINLPNVGLKRRWIRSVHRRPCATVLWRDFRLLN